MTQDIRIRHQPIRGKYSEGMTNERAGTGHCPPVTPINRERPLSAEVTLHQPIRGQYADHWPIRGQYGHSLGTRGDRGMSQDVTCHVLSHSDQVRFAENIVLHF